MKIFLRFLLLKAEKACHLQNRLCLYFLFRDNLFAVQFLFSARQENLFYSLMKLKNENHSSNTLVCKMECEYKYLPLLIKHNSDRGSFSNFRTLYKNFSSVIIFYDSFYE